MSNDFIEDYYSYVEPLEVPSIFHLWCALFCLSAAAQRKIWLDQGLFKIAPNLYIVLDADPGIGKDTAMNVARDLLNEVPTIKKQTDSITKEAIYESMFDAFTRTELKGNLLKEIVHCSLTIFASELSLLIKKTDKDFVPALCNLYNCNPSFSHKTRGSGEVRLICPYLAIISGTTPDWIAENIQNDVLEGGLTARTIMVFSNDRSKINPWPTKTIPGLLAYPRLIKRLEEVTQLAGEFKWHPVTRKLYEEWYHPHRKTVPKNPVMKGYHTRKPVHLMKLMMLLSLSYKDELVMEEGDFFGAMKILNDVEPCMEKALRGAGRNELSAITQSIADQIKSGEEGRISLTELYKLNAHRLRGADFKEVIDSLRNMGLVKTRVVKQEGKLDEVYLEFVKEVK